MKFLSQKQNEVSKVVVQVKQNERMHIPTQTSYRPMKEEYTEYVPPVNHTMQIRKMVEARYQPTRAGNEYEELIMIPRASQAIDIDLYLICIIFFKIPLLPLQGH